MYVVFLPIDKQVVKGNNFTYGSSQKDGTVEETLNLLVRDVVGALGVGRLSPSIGGKPTGESGN